MKIHAVTKETAPIWAELCLALWPDADPKEFAWNPESTSHPHEFLGFQGEEAVAFISLSLRTDYVEGCESSPVGYIEGIYVKPSHRRKGAASALVDFAKSWSREMGCRELASDCELSNVSSHLFHTRMNFQEVNTVICFKMDLE